MQRLDGEGAKQMSYDPSITPEDLEERVRLPAGRDGGTRWGNEYSGGRCEEVRSPGTNSSTFLRLTATHQFLK